MSDFVTSLVPVQDNWPKKDPTQSAKAPTKSDRWLRKIDLTVSDAAGSSSSSLNLTPEGWVQFQVTFQVRKVTNQTPNMLFARIYNLSPDTINKIAQYRRVTLSAGYQTSPYGTIFTGEVVQYRRGKENATDTYLEIYGGDGDKALGYDVVNRSWDAGTTHKQRVTDYINQSGLEPGRLDMGGYGDEKTVRAMVQQRNLAQALRVEAQSGGLNVWVEDGKVNVIPKSGYIPGAIVELSPTTGLIGIPEVTPQGIQIRCLLDPNLKLGGLVKVKTDLISGVPFLPGSGSSAPVTPDQQGQAAQLSVATWGQQLTLPAFTSPTGTYKILMMDITGETRGTTWYCDLVCVALDASGNFIPNVGLPYERIPAQSNLGQPSTQPSGSSTNL